LDLEAHVGKQLVLEGYHLVSSTAIATFGDRMGKEQTRPVAQASLFLLSLALHDDSVETRTLHLFKECEHRVGRGRTELGLRKTSIFDG